MFFANATAELYDPATGSFSATSSMTMARASHTATLLATGKVLVAGGTNDPTGAELYDPATGNFSATGSMTMTRGAHTATLLPNGKVLATGGGFNRGPGEGDFATAELYDPATGSFSATGRMATARIYHTATLLPTGKVLVTGGGATGILNSAELFQ